MDKGANQIAVEVLPLRRHNISFNPTALSLPVQYRPHLRAIGGSGELLGIALMDGPMIRSLPAVSHTPLSNSSMSQVYLMRDWLKARALKFSKGRGLSATGKLFGGDLGGWPATAA
jgi:hypothetical protein